MHVSLASCVCLFQNLMRKRAKVIVKEDLVPTSRRSVNKIHTAAWPLVFNTFHFSYLIIQCFDIGWESGTRRTWQLFLARYAPLQLLIHCNQVTKLVPIFRRHTLKSKGA